MKEELIDVLSEQGKPTGEVLPLSEVHSHELWHAVSHIWIYNQKGEILLQLRHPSRSWGANRWDLSAGGHISATETPLTAAIREAEEEIGLKIDSSLLQLAGVTTAVNITETTGKTHKTHEWNYIAEIDVDLSNLKLQKDETSEVGWFKLQTLEKDLSSDLFQSKYAPRSRSLYSIIVNKVKRGIYG